MKTLIYSLLSSVLFFTACNSTSKKQERTSDTSNLAKTDIKAVEAATGTPISAILSAYFELKDALTKDNDKDAASSGKALERAFANVNQASLATDKAKIFEDIANDAKEHAEHIGANAGNIKHQREHFETLSEDIYDLVKAFGAGQTLYVDHCPMYNNNKGANWVSQRKEISNPYLGQSMATCGTVKEELN
ncbi:DUF3347 domain-containing protein [Pedobacter foliorum]|uniref:DUF3347 domain-containing protein n=1 Tax=Pedobacter foliorum TaxID=2739058 RepID=UPI0015666E2F|nr:DUF3347 domain-containing protein [Pedobacter foliorum]NRF40107.1 DUF3347 domain-containing protein [Pedobacter foliorum]